ncbi:hypothetical protein [Methanosphaerula palustris]|uniref:hypothetical protein n=1 Tax=Methanosphaerula palustris TaxID=475088 RepID=UPI0011D15647|nr:hypothetical protein [Methanosphaerula palustris]
MCALPGVEPHAQVGSWKPMVVASTKVLSWMTSGMPASGRTFAPVGLTPELLVPAIMSCSILSVTRYGAASPA